MRYPVFCGNGPEDEAARLIKDLLMDTEGFKVTEGYSGKEAKFIAALNGMNAGKQK